MTLWITKNTRIKIISGIETKKYTNSEFRKDIVALAL
jgi:hypothetical protein